MVYIEWKPGSRFKANAEKVSQELEMLDEKTPEKALEKARNIKTELHKCVTWDDTTAANLYRREEIGQVIRSIVVIEKEDEDDNNPVVYRKFEYVSVEKENSGEEKEKTERHFIVTREALVVPVFRDQIFGEIRRAISELSRKIAVYRDMSEETMDTVQYHLDMAQEAIKK